MQLGHWIPAFEGMTGRSAGMTGSQEFNCVSPILIQTSASTIERT